MSRPWKASTSVLMHDQRHLQWQSSAINTPQSDQPTHVLMQDDPSAQYSNISGSWRKLRHVAALQDDPLAAFTKPEAPPAWTTFEGTDEGGAMFDSQPSVEILGEEPEEAGQYQDDYTYDSTHGTAHRQITWLLVHVLSRGCPAEGLQLKLAASQQLAEPRILLLACKGRARCQLTIKPCRL